MSIYQRHLAEVNYSLFGEELLIDNFAGAGGASIGIEDGLGRTIDLAINHNPLALKVHKANHPRTDHAEADVWDVSPQKAANGQPVGLCWFSPDCRHHCKAKGGRPVSKSVRGLAWVAARWAATVKPRVICLENVTEFMDWGPLIKGPDGKMRPCPKRKGQTFRAFIRCLQRHGYCVDWKVLRASDYGVPTIRERFFLVARRDGRPIKWPAPTHGAPDSLSVKRGKLKPSPQGAQCIDWTIPTKSIFGRPKPLAEATLRRIANGIVRFVLQNPQPYFVDSPFFACRTNESTSDIPEAEERIAQFLKAYAPVNSTSKRKKKGTPESISKSGTYGVLELEKQLAAFVVNMKGRRLETRVTLAQDTALDKGSSETHLTLAFLAPYYGNGSGLTGRDLYAPLPTVTCKDRLKLVTVTLDSKTCMIIDIGMRMLQPHELAKAQGFPDYYIFDKVEGKRIAKKYQVQLIGNSVPPPLAKAIVQANFTHERLVNSPLAA